MLFLGSKKRQKALKKHSLEHSEPGAQKRSKSTPWGTFRPGPLGTPVDWDRNSILRAKKEPQSQRIARTAPKKFLNNSRALPNQTRVLRQIMPESSPESSAKSLSQKFSGVPFLSLKVLDGEERANLRSLCSAPPIPQKETA